MDRCILSIFGTLKEPNELFYSAWDMNASQVFTPCLTQLLVPDEPIPAAFVYIVCERP